MRKILASAQRTWESTLPIRERLDSSWKSPWMGAIVLVVFWIAAIHWLFVTPSPGKSVAVLAVVATVMTFRGELGGVEKTFLTLVLFLFVFIEVKAIDKDQAKNDQQQKIFFQTQKENFSGVTTQASKDFASTTSGLRTAINGLNTVLGTTQGIAQLAKENLENVTGGNRVLALEIVPGLDQEDVGRAFVFSPDRGIVRNVHIRVVNFALFDQDVKTMRPTALGGITAHDIDFEVGDIGLGEGENLQPPIILGPGEFVRFNIFFSGLNGMWMENLYMRKKGGHWFEAFRVFRKYTKLTTQTDRDVVYKQIGKGYLEKNEKMNWDAVPQ
jgi:Ca2+/Na+ antiporter